MKNIDKTADNQNIVRCKDCCFCEETKGGLFICCLPFGTPDDFCLKVTPDFYCGNGSKSMASKETNYFHLEREPLARCINCTHCASEWGELYCCYYNSGINVEEDYFCANGEEE